MYNIVDIGGPSIIVFVWVRPFVIAWLGSNVALETREPILICGREDFGVDLVTILHHIVLFTCIGVSSMYYF